MKIILALFVLLVGGGCDFTTRDGSSYSHEPAETKESRPPKRTSFAGATLAKANMEGSQFYADFTGCNMDSISARGADFKGCIFRDATLRGADLRNTDMRGTDLRGTDMSDANILGMLLNNGTDTYMAIMDSAGGYGWEVVGASEQLSQEEESAIEARRIEIAALAEAR